LAPLPVSGRSLVHEGFLRSAARVPHRPALELAGETLTYESLASRARAVAATLVRHTRADAPGYTAVLAQRTPAMFVGILGALLRGHAYVPLNPAYPPARTATMLDRTQSESVVADAQHVGVLDALLGGTSRRMTVLLPDEADAEPLQRRWPRHTILGRRDLLSPEEWRAVDVAPESAAYVLFTSGSTGTPKGVMVTHVNVRALVDAAAQRFGIVEEDRFSQTFDATFDLSVFDLFVAWERGACVVCPPAKTLLNPASFIREAELTVWFSVPSLAAFMMRLGALKPASFPGLRWSLFCGEALPVEVAAAWSRAAPNAALENLYGPTEATVFCTAYRWDDAASAAECDGGIVPIGRPLPRVSVAVVDDDLRDVPPGEEGELVIGGEQVARGYLDDPERTAAAFVHVPGREGVHYRTGDRVRRPLLDGPLVFRGRLDHQIKVLGHRVELGDVEAALRRAADAQAAVAVGWPRTASGAAGIVAFVHGTAMEPGEIRDAVAEVLPPYMVPRDIRVLDELPLTANGKTDRNTLLQTLEEHR